MNRKAAILTIAVVAIAVFAFFVPVIRGTSEVGRCVGLPACSPASIETYSSITYYYSGFGGAFYPTINSYTVYLGAVATYPG